MDASTREQMFRGDSIEKRKLLEAQEQASLMRKARREQRLMEKKAEIAR